MDKLYQRLMRVNKSFAWSTIPSFDVIEWHRSNGTDTQFLVGASRKVYTKLLAKNINRRPHVKED
jgi:hypothetical protein